MKEAVSAGRGWYLIAGLSFVPGAGLAFALAALVRGILAFRRGGWVLIVAALLGGAVSGWEGLIFGELVLAPPHFLGRQGMVRWSIDFPGSFGKPMPRAQAQALAQWLDATAQRQLSQLVAEIELYKVQFGHYPETLDALKQTEAKAAGTSDSFIDLSRGGSMFVSHDYYYRLEGDHYELRGVGPDGAPFTADDVLPKLAPGPAGGIGLISATAN